MKRGLMKKITFIKLAHSWQYDPYSDPPLGLLSVASAARDTGLVEVVLLDLAHEKNIPYSDIYAFSATTLEYLELIQKAKEIKSKYPEAKIIVGGPHFDIFPEEYWMQRIKKMPVDIISRGEGEATIKEIIQKIYDSPENAQNIVISQKGSLLRLSDLPLPARDLLDKSLYFKPGKTFFEGRIYSPGNSSTIIVSRGCPNNCSFCASPFLHNKKLRFRNFDQVKEELRILQIDYGVSSLRWQDDCIPLVLNNFPGLDKILNHMGIYSRGSARTDQITNNILDKLWFARFREIGFGIESAEDNVLSYINKRTNVDNNKKALLMTKSKGFKTRVFIMTGLPGETKYSADKMIEFLEETNPDVITLTSFMPLPGSDIFMNPDKYGVRITSQDWNDYDISLKWDAGAKWVHNISTATIDEMENNREKLKEYLFNKSKSNLHIYNKQYQSPILKS